MLPAFRHATFGRMQACYPQAHAGMLPEGACRRHAKSGCLWCFELGSLFLRRCSHTSLVEFQKLKRPSTSPFVAAGYRRMADIWRTTRTPRRRHLTRKMVAAVLTAEAAAKSARSRATIAETKGPGAAASVVVMTEATTTVAVAGTNVMVVTVGNALAVVHMGVVVTIIVVVMLVTIITAVVVLEVIIRTKMAGSIAQSAGRGSAAVITWSSTRRQAHAVAASKDTARPKSVARCAASEWQRSAGLSNSTRGNTVQPAMWRWSSEISRSKRRHPHPIPRLGQTAATAGCGFSLSWWFGRTSTAARATTRHQSLMCHQRMWRVRTKERVLRKRSRRRGTKMTPTMCPSSIEPKGTMNGMEMGTTVLALHAEQASQISAWRWCTSAASWWSKDKANVTEGYPRKAPVTILASEGYPREAPATTGHRCHSMSQWVSVDASLYGWRSRWTLVRIQGPTVI